MSPRPPNGRAGIDCPEFLEGVAEPLRAKRCDPVMGDCSVVRAKLSSPVDSPFALRPAQDERAPNRSW